MCGRGRRTYRGRSDRGCGVAMNRHAWLQKHPSPLAARGEFHWFPDAGSAHREDRELRAGFVERVRGVEPPAVLWQLERGRVAWGQVVSATAPLDGRRYVGLVLSIVEGEHAVADLLAALSPPPPVPWSEGVAIESRDRKLAVQELVSLRRRDCGDVVAVARALLSGGVARIEDPASAELPAWIASLERVMPEPGAKPRCGVWSTAGAGPAAGIGPAGSSGAVRDRVAELAVAAWREPGSRPAKAWTLLCELAAVRGESVDRVGAVLEAADAADAHATRGDGTLATGGDGTHATTGEAHATGKAHATRTEDVHAKRGEGAHATTVGERALAQSVLSDAERADVGGCRRVVDVLHAWGRGRLDRSTAAGSLPGRLADLVALRALTRLAAGHDAERAIAEARWYALLSAERRYTLLAAIAQRTASLRALVEGTEESYA